MTVKRYTFGTDRRNNIGQPAIIEHPQGEYMLVADHDRIVAGYQLHEELLLARLRRAEAKTHE